MEHSLLRDQTPERERSRGTVVKARVVYQCIFWPRVGRDLIGPYTIRDRPRLGLHHSKGVGCKVEGGVRRVYGIGTNDGVEDDGHVGLL